MIHCNALKRFMILFFIVLYITVLFVPSYFSKSVSATFETVTINPILYSGTMWDYENTIQSITIASTQNTTTAYQKTTDPIEGFSNIICKSGYGYVQMTGQYTAGNTSYKVIFLRMVLLDDKGYIIAKGFGLVDNVDAHKTTAFNAIVRYPSTFSSCIIQIDSAIPK